MISAKGYSCSPMAILLPFLLSAVILTTSAFRSETDGDDRTSSVQSPKTGKMADSPPCCAGDNLEGNIQARFKRLPPSTPGLGETVSWKGLSIQKPRQSQMSKGKVPLSDTELRWQSTGDEDKGKSHGDLKVEPGRWNLEEMPEERGNGISNGKWIVKNELNHGGIKPSSKAVDNGTELDRKRAGSRKLGEDSRGINRFLSVGWSKSKSTQRDTGGSSRRTRRDLRALKRMLDDAEVPQIGKSFSGDATLRQDFSKQPKYYPDGGPTRTWRINMMRIWGKRYLAG